MSDPMPPAPQSNEPYGAPTAGGGAAAGRLNGLAVAALVIGIASVTFLLTFDGITGLVALVLGIVARRQIPRNGQRGAGMALAGIILGAIGIIIGVVLLIVARAVLANVHK